MRKQITLLFFAFLCISSFAADDIVISPESGTDIAAELASAVESVEAVGNITINLAEDGEYTVSAPLVASQSLVINGNGAIINASDLGAAFINYPSCTGEKAKKADNTDSDYTIVANITVKDVVISGLGQSFINNGAGKVLFKNVLVDNCVIEIKGSNVIFALGGGYPEDLKITNSTLWSVDGHTNFLFQAHGLDYRQEHLISDCCRQKGQQHEHVQGEKLPCNDPN